MRIQQIVFLFVAATAMAVTVSSIPVGLGGKGVRQTRDLKSVLQKAAIGGAGVVVGASLAGVALSGSNSKGADRKLIPSHVSSCKYSPPPRPPPPSLAGKAKKEKVD